MQGRAPEYLRYNPDLMRITRHFFATGKPVAVICHGVEIVAAAGVLKGRTMTTIAKCALDVTQFGGTCVDKPYVLDGKLVSARGWQDYKTPFMKVFIRLLKAHKPQPPSAQCTAQARHGSNERTTRPTSTGCSGSVTSSPSRAFSSGPGRPASSRGEQFQDVGTTH